MRRSHVFRKRMTHKRSSRKEVPRKGLSRKGKTRKGLTRRGGAAFEDSEKRVIRILTEAGEGFAPTEEFPRDDVIALFAKRPEKNLRDAIAAVKYVQGLSRSADEDDQVLYKILKSFSIESEHREFLTNRFLDYQSLRQLLKLIGKTLDEVPNFTFPLVLMKYYQFFVLHEEGEKREEGIRLFKAAAIRMLRNAISMAKGLMKGPKTTAPMILYRGLNITYEQYEQGMNGSYQTGFSSTSLNEGSARLFVRNGFMMRIHVPVDTPISCYGLSGEFEIPLPIGSVFVVRRNGDNVIQTEHDGMNYVDFDLELKDGIVAVEKQYMALIEKIEDFTEQQLTEIFHRSYPDYRGPGSVLPANSQESNASQLDQYLPSESQEIDKNAKRIKRLKSNEPSLK